MRCLATRIHKLGGRRNHLYGALFLAAAVWSLLAAPSAADIFRYIDDDGVIHYTDDLDRVPAKFKDSVQQQKSVRREPIPETENMRRQKPLVVNADEAPEGAAAPEGESAEPEETAEEAAAGDAPEDAGNASPESTAEIEEGTEMQPSESPPEGEAPETDAAEFRRRLEEERQVLLERKEALANETSSQRSGIKEKYINRPQVQELMEEVSRIDQRLGEIENQLRQ